MESEGVSGKLLRERDQALLLRHKLELDRAEKKYQQQQYSYDRVKTQLFELDNQAKRLVEVLGFDDIQDAIAHAENERAGRGLSYLDCIAAVESLETELAIQKADNALLQAELIERSTEKPRLAHLQERYDQLLDLKNRMQDRYQNDYKKWRDFKVFMARQETELKEKKMTATSVERKALQLAHDAERKGVFTEMGPNLHMFGDDCDKENTPTPSATRLHTPISTPTPAVEMVENVLVASSSDTEPDSSPIHLPFKVPEVARKRPRSSLGEPSETEDDSQMTPPSASVRRRSDIGVPSSNTGPATKLRRLSEDITGQASRSSRALKPVQPAPTPSNKGNTDFSVFKGRGRYAVKPDPSTGKTINAEFVIDPSRNKGVDYQFNDVVRGKDDRRQMHAGDCECCRDYYEAVGPLPPRLKAPLWRSPTSSPTSDRITTASAASRAKDVASHKQAISRHRHDWERPKTPPGYWNIGFPSTQEADQINEEATRMHQAKRKNINEEAKRADGRYKRR